MALTRIRAEQISDIDYKQAVRVIVLADITLSGGTPAVVDGISLVVGDRILVAGNDPGSENGLYVVQTVGAGNNGTWIRSSDGNTTGEIEAGMIVMVTEGDTYKDTQWKLITNNPIVVGTTPLVFEQNSAFAFGNIYANGTAILANSVGDTVTLTAGNNIEITGNNVTKTIGIGVTGISLNSISNGTSNVNVVSSGGNVTIGVAGTNNTAVFGQYNTTFAGNLLPSSNITYDLGTSAQRWRDIWLSNSTIYLGSAQISANSTALILTNPSGAETILSGSNSSISASSLSASGNITGGNLSITGNVVTGNIRTDGYFYANGAVFGGGGGGGGTPGGSDTQVQFNDNNVFGGVAGFTFNKSTTALSITGNVTAGNVSGTNITGTLATAAQTNITSVGTLSSLSVTGNVTSGNLSGTNIVGTLTTAAQTNITSVGTLGSLSVTGNITGGNLSGTNIVGTLTTVSQTNITAVGTLTSLSVTGNVTSSNLNLSGDIYDTGALTINTAANGNITLSPNGTGLIVANKDIRNGQANGVGNIGTTGAVFNTIFAKATSAQYADVAERYQSDSEYPVGTVLVFGGDQEVTASTQSHDTAIAGTISENPSYIMNAGLEGNHVVTVALLGRVPCKIIGPIKKGDLLVSSDKPGVATKLDLARHKPGCVIGKSLNDYDRSDEGMIEIVVGRL